MDNRIYSSRIISPEIVSSNPILINSLHFEQISFGSLSEYIILLQSNDIHLNCLMRDTPESGPSIIVQRLRNRCRCVHLNFCSRSHIVGTRIVVAHIWTFCLLESFLIVLFSCFSSILHTVSKYIKVWVVLVYKGRGALYTHLYLPLTVFEIQRGI